MESKKVSRQERRREERERNKALRKRDNNLFNNPMVNSARNALTDEQKEEYKKIGEQMYNTVDFNSAGTDPLAESVAYIREGLKSGLHPSFLPEDEIKVLEEYYGKEWYKHFGYSTLDIDEEADESQNPQ